jgi:hypothetical protein
MNKVLSKLFLGFILWACLASTGICLAEGMAYREEREATLRQTECQAPQNAVVHDVWLEAAPKSGLITTVNVEPGEYVRIILVCQAGTGYEWKAVDSRISFLETVKEQVLPFPQSGPITGGKVASVFLYKTSDAARGDDRLSFALYRAWEGVDKGVSFVDVNVHYVGDDNNYKI